MSAGRRRVRKHNRERGPYSLTASPSDGPGVRSFWPPAIDLRMRGKSLSKKPCLLERDGRGGGEPNVTKQRQYQPRTYVWVIGIHPGAHPGSGTTNPLRWQTC